MSCFIGYCKLDFITYVSSFSKVLAFPYLKWILHHTRYHRSIIYELKQQNLLYSEKKKKKLSAVCCYSKLHQTADVLCCNHNKMTSILYKPRSAYQEALWDIVLILDLEFLFLFTLFSTWLDRL